MTEKLSFLFFVFGVFQIYSVKECSAGGNMCGTPKADPEKTCISLRLPWQAEPIYFCVDKDKFEYKKESCGIRGLCGDHFNDKTLLLATPWSCCPISSTPDHCGDGDVKCPPNPFNRTCTIPSDQDYECCPTAFCEDGTHDDCKFKVLEPECTRPANKTNCTAFKDQHGCCPKFQCDGEGKPGVCPMESKSKNFTSYSSPQRAYPGYERRNKYKYYRNDRFDVPYDAGLASDSATEGSQTDLPVSSTLMDTTTSTPEEMSTTGSYGSFFPQPSYFSRQSCVGDYTCPGAMKCCGSMGFGYHSYGENEKPNQVYGYCVEPIVE